MIIWSEVRIDTQEIIWKERGAKIFFLLILSQIIKMIWVKLDLAPKLFDRFTLKLIFTSPLSFSRERVLLKMVLNTDMIT
jgi:hypothetical protein